MKPVLEFLPKDGSESFLVNEFDFKYYPTPWHFHPEYEIVLITNSTGKRFIGGNISNFKPGNLAIIGSNLPHLYRNDAAYYKPNSRSRATSIVVHFLENSFGDHFLSLPEMKKIKQLLIKSLRGLEMTGKTNKIVSEKLFELVKMSGCSRFLKLLEVLHIMSESKECHFISEEAITGANEKESERIDKVLKFVMVNLGDDITLPDVAKVANMSENSFSRFFKQRTRKTFTSYLNELRLNQAAKLLIESDKTIVDICYECGFNNLSNFHRYFKRMYDTSPLHYRKTFWDTV
ncbi:MAG: AraC family transcriptional regulator [Chitinophagaceae bacterium]|nr:AraC family transcriptional regulator [Chitinophagaceae bacterium]